MKNDLFPAAAVRPAEDLTELLAEAVAEHDAAERCGRESLEHYRLAGLAFKKAKAAAGHGKWLTALKRTGVSSQRASECMRLADGWDKLPPDGNFGLKGALALIAGDEPAECPAAADEDEGAAPEPVNFWDTVRELGVLLVEARKRVIARHCARCRAEPYAGDSPDDLFDGLRAKMAAYRRAAREEILTARCKMGDDEARELCEEMLVRDGMPREEAKAVSGRVHAGLYPAGEDVGRVADAFMGWQLRKEGCDIEADMAADEKEEQDAYRHAYFEAVERFLVERGLDPHTEATPELLGEFDSWYGAGLKAAGWDVPDDQSHADDAGGVAD
jgi:hypothetical protein